ncbi:MAG TPA: alpha/beta hydrolase [Candidatus Sulfotelmatobacter sp.]|jgi:pimeloyl-ACP methyl ester carboxylesterase|nr:alpha/beta hydrolase [Candidatus Sulfotelmatobacter sp.]
MRKPLWKQADKPVSLKRLLGWLILALMLQSPALAGDHHEVGIVLMHGKWGSPNAHIDQLAAGLKNAGYQVTTPTMPWAGRRGYDKTFDAAMDEIGFAIDVLRVNGAKRIIVGGHSLGANAALAYGAHHPGLLGIMAIAPGHTPELADFRARMADKVADAKAKVDAGKGEDSIVFNDVNQGQARALSLSANIFLSYNNPDGLANMSENAVHQSAPVLIVVGDRDRMATLGQDYLFNRLPPNNFNRYLSVEADHLGTPSAAQDGIIAWVNEVSGTP